MNTGENIKRIRKEKGITQKQLATDAGISEISIRKYEAGDREPKIETIQKIANSLGVSATALKNDYATFKNEVISNSPLLCVTQKDPDNWLFREHLQSRIIAELNMTEDKQMLIVDYNKLNQKGQEEARKRVNELTEIPKYKK